jgi:hypothetical protein
LATTVGYGYCQLAGFSLDGNLGRTQLCGEYFMERELFTFLQLILVGLVLAADCYERQMETEPAMGKLPYLLALASKHAVGYSMDHRIIAGI